MNRRVCCSRFRPVIITWRLSEVRGLKSPMCIPLSHGRIQGIQIEVGLSPFIAGARSKNFSHHALSNFSCTPYPEIETAYNWINSEPVFDRSAAAVWPSLVCAGSGKPLPCSIQRYLAKDAHSTTALILVTAISCTSSSSTAPWTFSGQITPDAKLYPAAARNVCSLSNKLLTAGSLAYVVWSNPHLLVSIWAAKVPGQLCICCYRTRVSALATRPIPTPCIRTAQQSAECFTPGVLWPAEIGFDLWDHGWENDTNIQLWKLMQGKLQVVAVRPGCLPPKDIQTGRLQPALPPNSETFPLPLILRTIQRTSWVAVCLPGIHRWLVVARANLIWLPPVKRK